MIAAAGQGTQVELVWAHGRVAVQRLGAMVGPLRLELPGGGWVEPLYRAPWHGADGAALAANPLLRHLNGEWLCLPYGPAGPHPGLPPGWRPRAEAAADAGFDHGWVANQPWQVEHRAADGLVLSIVPPHDHPLARVERRVLPNAAGPGLRVTTRIEVRRAVTLPIALHPTFALPPEGLELRPGACRAVHAYPLAPVPGVSRVQPGQRAASLRALATVDGSAWDLTRLPLARATEELVQLEDCRPPFVLRLPARAGRHGAVDLVLDWDADVLPDVLLWFSQRGRPQAPWNGRNLALGIEPCHSCFDLSRVAEPPADHPLAHRRGVALDPLRPLTLGWGLRAMPVSAG